MSQAVSRNDPCPCGSGIKYKRCCLPKGGPEAEAKARRIQVLVILGVVASLAAFAVWGRQAALLTAGTAALVIGLAVYVFGDPPSAGGGGDPGAINFGR